MSLVATVLVSFSGPSCKEPHKPRFLEVRATTCSLMGDLLYFPPVGWLLSAIMQISSRKLRVISPNGQLLPRRDQSVFERPIMSNMVLAAYGPCLSFFYCSCMKHPESFPCMEEKGGMVISCHFYKKTQRNQHREGLV